MSLGQCGGERSGGMEGSVKIFGMIKCKKERIGCLIRIGKQDGMYFLY
jgi:hypothetical protein